MRLEEIKGELHLCLIITSNDANPWGDSRGMRLLRGRGGAMVGVH